MQCTCHGVHMTVVRVQNSGNENCCGCRCQPAASCTSMHVRSPRASQSAAGCEFPLLLAPAAVAAGVCAAAHAHAPPAPQPLPPSPGLMAEVIRHRLQHDFLKACRQHNRGAGHVGMTSGRTHRSHTHAGHTYMRLKQTPRMHKPVRVGSLTLSSLIIYVRTAAA